MNFPKGKGAWMAKVGEKGQIVIPKQARDMFGIQPGDTLLLLGDIEQGLAVMSGEKMAELAFGIFGSRDVTPQDERTNEDESNTDD